MRWCSRSCRRRSALSSLAEPAGAILGGERVSGRGGRPDRGGRPGQKQTNTKTKQNTNLESPFRRWCGQADPAFAATTAPARRRHRRISAGGSVVLRWQKAMPTPCPLLAAAPRSTAARPGHVGRHSSPRMPQANSAEKQPVGHAAISPPSSLLPHMPGLELKLRRVPPAEPALPRDEAPSSARLERHKRVEQMYLMALQRRREAALRNASDEHVAERFLAQEPPSVLAMSSAMPTRPPDAAFMNLAPWPARPPAMMKKGGIALSRGDNAITETRDDPLHNGELVPTTATARAQPVARCRSARSRSARTTRRAWSAPPRPLVPSVPEGDGWRQAEASAAAAIRSALERARAQPQGEVGVPASTTQSQGFIPLSMGSVEWRYPSRSPRPVTPPQLRHPERMRREHRLILLCHGAARGTTGEDRPTDVRPIIIIPGVMFNTTRRRPPLSKNV